MLKLSTILIAIGTAMVMWLFSTWRLKRTLDVNSSPLRDPMLGLLVTKMAKALDVPEVPVHVYEIEPVNGLASPDGRVFITRGFLRKYQAGEISADEMASVIAHELGHVALGHGQRRMLDFAGQNVLRLVLGVAIGRFVPFVGVYIANALTSLIAARLSRQDEYEADAYATALLTKAGLPVDAQVSLFTKLERMTPSHGQFAWMMSHPKPKERIAAIETLRARWGTARPTPQLEE